MARSMESFLANKTFNRFCRLLHGFGTEVAAIRIKGNIIGRFAKIVVHDSIIEGSDVMTSSFLKAEKEAKEEVLDEPDSSNRSITEDPSALYLDEASRMMEMDSDIHLDIVGVVDGEPEDTIELNSFVVKARLNV